MLQCGIRAINFLQESDELTAINDVPAMQRRRLSKLAKLALNSARQMQQSHGDIDYIVWSSCFGDEQNTLKILHEIANEGTASPTQFSTSVHNAIAGLYSILFQDDTVSTSISSPLSTCWQDALTEAYSYLQSNAKTRALVIYYDQPLPEVYIDQVADLTEGLAVSAIIEVNHSNLEPNIQIDFEDVQSINTGLGFDHAIQAINFYQFWQSNQTIWRMGNWVWKKC